MPALISVLGSFFAFALGGMVARVLAKLGMGIVTYVGVTALTNRLVQELHNQIGGIPSDVVQLLGVAGIDQALSLILSAHLGVISFSLAAGGFSKLAFMKAEDA